MRERERERELLSNEGEHGGLVPRGRGIAVDSAVLHGLTWSCKKNVYMYSCRCVYVHAELFINN